RRPPERNPRRHTDRRWIMKADADRDRQSEERKRTKKKEKFGRGGLWKLPDVWKNKNGFSTRPCKTPAGVSHSSHRLDGGINNKQQNRTFHLLQKPDIFICYRQQSLPAYGA